MSGASKSIKDIESSKSNNHKVQESLEAEKVGHHLTQKTHKQFTLGIPFNLHISSKIYAIWQV